MKDFREIMVKKPWGRVQPDPKFMLRTPMRQCDMKETPADEPLFKVITQADMLREYYPSGHLINSEVYYPNIYREEEVEVLDKDGNPTGETKVNRYEEHVPRYAFAFQRIIAIKQIVHVCNNDIQWDTEKRELSEHEQKDIYDYRSGWLKKHMELAFYEAVKSVKIVGDVAVVGYLDKGEFGWKALSYFQKHDILFPHFNAKGELELFARAYSDFDADGNKVVNWLEVWDDTYLYRYKQDLKGTKGLVSRIKEVFGLSGYVEVSKEKHGFPFVPVAYHRDEDGACWNASQDSIDGYELAFSEMAQNNHTFGVPTMYLQGENVEAVHDINGSVRVLTMGTDDKAGYLEAQSAAESYERQLDINYKMIMKQSFAVETPAISGNSDISGAAIKILYADAEEKASIDANEYQPLLEGINKIFAFGYGMEKGKTIDYQKIPLSPWIKPWVAQNESGIIADLATAVGAGFLSKQTASERSSFYSDDSEWERVVREAKEQQETDLLYEIKSAQAQQPQNTNE